MTRRKLSPKQRALLFLSDYGRCQCCLRKIADGEKWHADHFNPNALSGDNSDGNFQVLCIPCHRRKTFGTKATTAGSDIHAIAKVKRLIKGKTPKRNIPSKPFDKRFTKRFDGTVVERAA